MNLIEYREIRKKQKSIVASRVVISVLALLVLFIVINIVGISLL